MGKELTQGMGVHEMAQHLRTLLLLERAQTISHYTQPPTIPAPRGKNYKGNASLLKVFY